MTSLLLGNKDRIDFSSPILMNVAQRKKFIELMKELYEVIEEEPTLEFRSDRLGSKEIHATWTAKEYLTLLKISNPVELPKKLGRTHMGVEMRLGNVIPRLFSWCENNNISLDKITLQNIEQFLKEVENKKLEKKKEKKFKNEITKQIEKMLNAKEPCKVEDPKFWGGECKDGFYKACILCPRSYKFIKNEEDIDLFNKIYQEEFED